MRVKIRVKDAGTVQNLNKRKDLILVTDSQDVKAIKDHLGHHEDVEDFDGFFVKIEDGDYSEIYGFEGSVPWLGKSVYNIDMKLVPSRKLPIRKMRRV